MFGYNRFIVEIIMTYCNKEGVYDLDELKPENTVEIEAIDMTLPEDQIIELIMQNLQEVGFFSLTNVEGFNQEEVHEAVKAFYEEIPPWEHKKMIQKAFNMDNENRFLGIVPTALNQKAHNAQYQMRYPISQCTDQALKLPLYEDTPFPPQEEFQWIRERLLKFYNLMHKTAMKLIEYLAIGLGKDRTFFN